MSLIRITFANPLIYGMQQIDVEGEIVFDTNAGLSHVESVDDLGHPCYYPASALRKIILLPDDYDA